MKTFADIRNLERVFASEVGMCLRQLPHVGFDLVATVAERHVRERADESD